MLLGVLVSLFRPNAPIAAKAAAILVLFVTLVYSVLQSEPRYAIPFRGVEMLLAMSGIVSVAGWARARWSNIRQP